MAETCEICNQHPASLLSGICVHCESDEEDVEKLSPQDEIEYLKMTAYTQGREDMYKYIHARFIWLFQSLDHPFEDKGGISGVLLEVRNLIQGQKK